MKDEINGTINKCEGTEHGLENSFELNSFSFYLVFYSSLFKICWISLNRNHEGQLTLFDAHCQKAVCPQTGLEKPPAADGEAGKV